MENNYTKKIRQKTYELEQDYKITTEDLIRLFDKISGFLRANSSSFSENFRALPHISEGIVSSPIKGGDYNIRGCSVKAKFYPTFSGDNLEMAINGKEADVKNLEKEIKEDSLTEWCMLYSSIPSEHKETAKKNSYFEEEIK